MTVEVLYFEGCPNWAATRDLVEQVTGRKPLLRRIESPEEAESAGFAGSPTLLVDGVDPWADQAVHAGLACRTYRTPDGQTTHGPTEAMLRKVLESAA